MKPALEVNTATVVVTGLIGGWLTARETGIRPLGGVVLGWPLVVRQRRPATSCRPRHLLPRSLRPIPSPSQENRCVASSHRSNHGSLLRRLRAQRPKRHRRLTSSHLLFDASPNRFLRRIAHPSANDAWNHFGWFPQQFPNVEVPLVLRRQRLHFMYLMARFPLL